MRYMIFPPHFGGSSGVPLEDANGSLHLLQLGKQIDSLSPWIRYQAKWDDGFTDLPGRPGDGKADDSADG